MNSFDFSIIHFLNQFAQRSSFFDRIIALVSEKYLFKGGVAMTIFWWVWFDRKKRTDEDRKILIFGIILSLIGVFIARALAIILPFRQRPWENPSLHFRLPFAFDPKDLIGWSSFPSDHATLFFCLAVTLLFVSRKLGIGAILYTCIVICFPRVYLGVHYPTDILAGTLLGIAAGSLVGMRRTRQIVAGPILHWTETSPELFYPIVFFCTFSAAQQFDGIRRMGKFTFELAKIVISHLA